MWKRLHPGDVIVFYLIGQIAVCLLLTALLGVAVGWLVRGINARAEIDAMKRRAQEQLRDLRNRATSRPGSDELMESARVQQQLRHQLLKLQALVEQRDKEIAHLRQMIGDRRSAGGESGSSPETAQRRHPS